MDPNQAKFTQNWTFLATYTPDMVIIWPHMACLPIFLSHTTYTSHIPPHMGSNGRQIAVNRGFSCKNLPCSRLQKIITRPFFDLEPCPIHQNDHIVHLYNLYNSDLLKFKIFLPKFRQKWKFQKSEKTCTYLRQKYTRWRQHCENRSSGYWETASDARTHARTDAQRRF